MALKWTKNAPGALNSSADQPQISKLTKAIGVATVFGAMTALSPAAQALKTDFGMEYRATAFANQIDEDGQANGGTSDSDTGFGHLIRIKGNFLDEDTGISVFTSVEVAGDRWVGDNNGGAVNPSFNSTSRGDNVRLDLGYVQIPVGHTVFRVGRQATSYNNCFLVCDDRRDRILVVQPFSKTTSVVAGYDRRSDATGYRNQDNGDMSLLGLTTKISDWSAGILWVQWYNNYEGARNPLVNPDAYPLSNVSLFSGYLDGSLTEALDMAVGFNLFTNGNVETGAPNDDRFFQEDAPSAYLRLGTNLGMVDLGVQYAATRDGGLISPGFDTWSSLINSNPEATQSASSLYRMGGTLGLKDFDEDLLMARAKFNLTPKFSITGAVGQLSIDNGTNDDDSMVYDLQFAYQANKALRTWLSVGMIEENEVGTLSGNDLVGGGLGTFANDDVKAASLNMTVNF
ncbi:hypothetical protein LL252_11700 [Alcanivorax marinus]|uniref:Porin n=1 Tax=Alloalcanivorax marinus TaxID=1177169 RepID=A0A9Q3ULL7_9GAMM|nr:hypothetical protein [Alloalcanivorax marinus]MCC4309237.1 hypothetical protein [Alloalcanivorax marinus]MCU5787585.1 hypothetical protein [Alloalcanivorax marinus]